MSSPTPADHASARSPRWRRTRPQHVRHRSSPYRAEPAPRRSRWRRDLDSFLAFGLPSLALMAILVVVATPITDPQAIFLVPTEPRGWLDAVRSVFLG